MGMGFRNAVFRSYGARSPLPGRALRLRSDRAVAVDGEVADLHSAGPQAAAAARRDNIRANSVHPGIMPPMRTSGRIADPAVRAERMRFIPMRRSGEVDEVAYTILVLASDESPYITGSEIHVWGVLAI
jgi:NAD(P)-dependent dehydrogenase (short-subunit alcohol dehydrogenase family)